MGCLGCLKNTTKPKPIPTAPVLDEEGGITYPNGTRGMGVGYSVDPDNEQRIVPDEDTKCTERISSVILTKTGVYIPFHVCRHTECELRSQEVNLSICRECRFRTPPPSSD